MSPQSERKNYIVFIISMLLFTVAYALYHGVFDNYLANSMDVSKSGRGVVEFFRETPGLLLVVILALFYKVSEHKIIRIGYIVAVLGIIGMMLSKASFVSTVLFITVFSAGQHLLMPVTTSYAVHNAKKGKEGSALGLMKSIMGIGQVAGYFIVPLIFSVTARRGGGEPEGFNTTYIFVLGLIIAAVIVSLFLRSSSGNIERQRLYFHKKYTKYYVLQNFYGARKQVFITFGPYVLILMYGATPAVIASLLGVCSIISIFTTPLIGKIIDKVGYKAVMVGDTIILFFVCLIYGFSHHVFSHDVAYIVICGVFMLDHLISHASMAASVYVKDLSDSREEVTSTLTTGISLDHLISIFIALVGGMVWEYLGIELLFILAAGMAVMNSLIAWTIKPKLRLQSEAVE